jgi:hypothetical protein
VNDQMPEAEVSLRLAFWLAESGLAFADVKVAIDGAQVQTKTTVHFDLLDFMLAAGWAKHEAEGAWQGSYHRTDLPVGITVHSNPGKGDVVAQLASGRILRAECKKGPLTRSRSSQEYPLIREALGQLLTVAEVGDEDLFAVAVPHSPKFVELADRWRETPLVKRFGIRIFTVDRQGNVHGLEESRAALQGDEADEPW